MTDSPPPSSPPGPSEKEPAEGGSDTVDDELERVQEDIAGGAEGEAGSG